MSDYISRENAIKAICQYGTAQERIGRYAVTICELKQTVADTLSELSSADVRENIHGEWTEWKARNGRYKEIPICSNCNTGFPIFAKDYNFCPNCGADMRGET